MLCECLMGLMGRLIVQTATDKGSRQTTADQLGLEAQHRSWPDQPVNSKRTYNQRRRGDNDCCPRCGGRVFQAEKVLSARGVYHRACFRCAEVDCGRSLDASSYCNTPQGLVLCKTCYARLHGPQVRNFCDSFLFLHIFQGFGYSNTLVSDESRPNTPAGPRQTSSLSCSSTAR